jgi:tetratricopeptide (TPR) repeat protein
MKENATMKPNLTIVVYAICRDEAKFAERWMTSMKEADAVVVLDTGSRDGTAEKLRSLGAMVETKRYAGWNSIPEYRRIASEGKETPWRFDCARNDSIDLALRIAPDADILVCTDLDEVLLPGWRAKLEDAWTAYADAHGGVQPTTAQYEYVWNFNADGSDGTKFLYEKVHAAKCGARWTHPVHEILDYGDAEKRMVRVPGMRLEHRADPTKSRGQYLELLELSVAEDPADDRNMHYLGREYMFRRRWDDAIKTLTRHLSLPRATWRAERAASMRFIARCTGAKGDAQGAEIWLRRAMLEDAGQREAALGLAELMHLKKDWPALVRACEACISVKERRMSYITKSESWGSRPYDLYAIGLWYTGKREDAIRANEEAMRLDPANERMRRNDELMRRAVDGAG